MATKDNKKNTRPATSTAKPKRKQGAPRPADSEIVYTQPQPFNRNRFLLHLATVAAVVLAVVFGMSIFFKVDAEKITVSGTGKYTVSDVITASGLREGENLLTLNKAKISGKIITQLPYVKSVRIGIKLPDTVNIEIVEMDVVYAIESADSSWWLMDSSGKVVERITASEAKSYTQILGVQLEVPQIGSQAVAVEPEEQTDAAGQTVPVTIRGSERLSTVVSILQYLEQSGVIGQVASLNVSDMSNIELWYEDRYQVKLGDTTQLLFKVRSMKQAIDQQEDYQTGILDVSFTTWPDRVNLSRFPE